MLYRIFCLLFAANRFYCPKNLITASYWKWGEAKVLTASCSGVLQPLGLIKAAWSGNTSCSDVVEWGILWGAAGISLSLLRFCPYLMFTSTGYSDVFCGSSDTFTHQCYPCSGYASDIWSISGFVLELVSLQVLQCPDEFCYVLIRLCFMYFTNYWSGFSWLSNVCGSKGSFGYWVMARV